MRKFVRIVKDLSFINTINGVILPKYANIQDYYFDVLDRQDEWFSVCGIFSKDTNEPVICKNVADITGMLLKSKCIEFCHIEIIDNIEYTHEKNNHFGQDNVYCRDTITGCDFTIRFTNNSEINKFIKFLESIKNGDD